MCELRVVNMNEWTAISVEELNGFIKSSEGLMSLKERRYWESIKLIPTKWIEVSYGSSGGGFWVVALFGNQVIWYNDIEEGFNTSKYSQYGLIEEYFSNQDELHFVIKQLACF